MVRNRRRSLPLSIPIALTCIACGSAPRLEPAPPPPATPKPVASLDKPAPIKVAAVAASSAPAPQLPAVPEMAGSGPDGFKLAWVTTAGGWNHSLAIGPSGDVFAEGGHQLLVLARDTGKVLESVPACYAHTGNAIALIDATRGVIACSDQLIEFKVPGLVMTPVASFDGFRVEAAAFAPGRVAVGGDKVVRVLDSTKWSTLMDLKTSEEVESLAMSRDGAKLVIGYKTGTIEVRGVGSKAAPLTIKKAVGDHRIVGLAVSPDGSEFFANDSTFRAGTYPMRGGASLRQYAVGSWITTAIYLSATTIATAGSDGLLLMRAGLDKPEPFQTTGFGSTAEGIAASPDGAMLCSGDRDNHIYCFAKGVIASSSYKTSTRTAAVSTSAPPPTKQERQGTIASRTGQIITLRIAGTSAVALGAKGSLYRRFGQSIGSITMTGWLEVAEVIVRRLDAHSIDVEVIKEKSDIRVNGKRVDHFAPGETIKLETP